MFICDNKFFLLNVRETWHLPNYVLFAGMLNHRIRDMVLIPGMTLWLLTKFAGILNHRIHEMLHFIYLLNDHRILAIKYLQNHHDTYLRSTHTRAIFFSIKDKSYLIMQVQGRVL
jgi:hypothetical protein